MLSKKVWRFNLNFFNTTKTRKKENTSSGLNLQEGDLLQSSSAVYTVIAAVGEGCYGKVFRCRNNETHETVAIKVLKKAMAEDAKNELAMLDAISILDPDQTNLVRYYGSFVHEESTCLAFELLSMDLYDLVDPPGFKEYKPLSPCDIRPIAQQLLVGLDALKQLGIIHTDIKPDNVMLVGPTTRPYRAKLVDFGAALQVPDITLGMIRQPLGYRAPEVSLGLPFTEAIDVWAVGCILAFLYMADNLFPVTCEYRMMRSIVSILGQPPDHLLSAGGFTRYFFTEKQAGDDSRWRLMTHLEYLVANNATLKGENELFQLRSLDDLVKIYPVRDEADLEDRKALVDLLKGLLKIDQTQRLTPRAALEHPFFTMSYQQPPPQSGPLEDDSVSALVQPQEPPTTAQLDCQDSDSGLSQLSESDSSFVMVSELCDEDLLEVGSSESSDDSGAELADLSELLSDIVARVSATVLKDEILVEDESPESSPKPAAEQPLPGATSTGRFKQTRKAIRRFCKRIRNTLCCCFVSQTD